jgi:hypothetical protein
MHEVSLTLIPPSPVTLITDDRSLSPAYFPCFSSRSTARMVGG